LLKRSARVKLAFKAGSAAECDAQGPEMTLLDIDPPLAALNRLVTIAQSDTGQARRVANFLLAWWNASDCGGFDLTDLWMLDRAIIDDILSVVQLIARRHTYPDAYGLQTPFERLVADWRPRLAGLSEQDLA
jgi:hypothetical protein